MINEAKGKITADVGQRAEKTQNQWVVVMASEPQHAVDNRSFVPITAEVVLDRIRKAVVAKPGGIEGLLNGFNVMDDRGWGYIDKEDFRWGLSDYGVPLSKEEFDILHRAFNDKGDNFITYVNVIKALSNN